MKSTYKALLVEEPKPNIFIRSIKDLFIDKLPKNNVLIKVLYSALNYKDALSARGHKGITRNYPHTPGVDASGIVVECQSELYHPGDEVFITGYDLGMNTYGGFGQYIRVPAEWIVKPQPNISLRDTMIYGTAGFTAGICIHELQKHDVLPDSGKILVTGATGGVGCMAVAMLAGAGYHVVASTGKMHQQEFLTNIGAKEVIHRDTLKEVSVRPLLKAEWAGAIDTVGGNTLATIIKSLKPRSPVCALGLVESDTLNITVYPFLLRGVVIIGIDSAERPMPYRLNIWNRIFSEWKIQDLEYLIKEIGLEDLDKEIDLILQGGQCGKVLVNLWK